MTELFYDTETNVVSEAFAVIYAPRKNRKRFPSNCVKIVVSAEIAIQESDAKNNQYPARVMGPSRSSEGLMLYYLVEWIS